MEKYFMIVFTLVAHQSLASKLCKYTNSRDHGAPTQGYLIADCSNNRGLRDVPVDIRRETIVLDLSHNGIVKLVNGSFECCTSVKSLHLEYNRIRILESNVFERLIHLTELDLSGNPVTVLPYLPNTLEKLFLNLCPHLFERRNDTMERISQLKSLATLHLSENNLQKFPEFSHMMPNLVKLNLTGNSIPNVNVDDLARLCSLKQLDLGLYKVTDYSREEYCSCIEFRNWIHERVIDGPGGCHVNSYVQYLCEATIRESSHKIYRQCMTMKETREKSYRRQSLRLPRLML